MSQKIVIVKSNLLKGNLLSLGTPILQNKFESPRIVPPTSSTYLNDDTSPELNHQDSDFLIPEVKSDVDTH